VSHYELYLPGLLFLLVTGAFFAVGLTTLVFAYQCLKDKKLKPLSYFSLGSVLCFGLCYVFGGLTQDRLGYFSKILRLEAVTSREDLNFSGEAQKFHDKEWRVEFRALHLVGPNMKLPVEAHESTLSSTDLMNLEVPAHEFHEFTLIGRTYFSQGIPYLFVSDGKRVWFKIDALK